MPVATVIVSAALIAVFASRYAAERTLSIHSITSTRREAFYWAAILFTFALGTSAGDLFAVTLNLGFLPSALVFAGGIALIASAHRVLHLGPFLSRQRHGTADQKTNSS